MHCNSAVAAAILAFTSAVSAVPTSAAGSSTAGSSSAAASEWSSSTVSSWATASSTSSSVQSTSTSSLAGLGLSKTQQIFLSDTRADAINNVLTSNADFKFTFTDKAGGPDGTVVAANRKTFPALTNTGIGGAVGFLGPCGFNTPHVHPRATEYLFLIEGQIQSSMFPENGVPATGPPREIVNTLNPFDSTVYFEGSVHSQFNTGCGNATFFAALNSEDFGTGQVAQELFGTAADDEQVAAVFGNAIDGADIDKLRDAIPASVAFGVESCLQKCGIHKRK